MICTLTILWSLQVLPTWEHETPQVERSEHYQVPCGMTPQAMILFAVSKGLSPLGWYPRKFTMRKGARA